MRPVIPTVLFFSEEDYDLLTVTRPLSQVQAGSERPVTLPRVSDTGIQMSNSDGLRFYNKLRGGAATDAANITKQLCLSQ